MFNQTEFFLLMCRCHSLSHVVRGLVAGQTYVFRVRAENIHGASESSVESFPFTLVKPGQWFGLEEYQNVMICKLVVILQSIF